MARKKDLAGLATLAGLAYMASRDKGGEGPAPSAPAVAAAAEPTRGGDLMSEKEPGWESGTADESSARPAATASRPAAKPVAKPMGGSGRGGRGGATAEELAAYEASKPKKLQYQSLQDRARAYEEERAKSGVGMYGTRKSEPREPLPTASDMAYKKGGKVKKMASGGGVKGWGIARGSRKAKTY